MLHILSLPHITLGKIILQLIDKDGKILFEEELTEPQTSTKVLGLEAVPKVLKINFIGFSGSFFYVVKSK